MVVNRKLPMFSAFFTSLAREAVDSKPRLGRNILFFCILRGVIFGTFFGIFFEKHFMNFFEYFFDIS